MIPLRLNFTDVICSGSLKSLYADGKKVGCQFDVMLSYYRGHFLSTIDELRVRIDGQEIEAMNITFCLAEREYGLDAIPFLGNVFWPVTQPATIKVFKDGGFEAGSHDIEFIMYFRSPYMEIGPDMYMLNDGSGQKRLVLDEAC